MIKLFYIWFKFLTNHKVYLSLEFLISSFISLHSFSTLFTEANSSWLILKLIQALEIKTSMAFQLAFAKNTILSCSFFFFLITDLYFLIPAVITQIFIVAAELAIPTGIQIKEVKVETHPVTVEAKISKGLV